MRFTIKEESLIPSVFVLGCCVRLDCYQSVLSCCQGDVSQCLWWGVAQACVKQTWKFNADCSFHRPGYDKPWAGFCKNTTLEGSLLSGELTGPLPKIFVITVTKMPPQTGFNLTSFVFVFPLLLLCSLQYMNPGSFLLCTAWYQSTNTPRSFKAENIIQITC